MTIRVIIPIGSLVRDKIKDTYTTLYDGYCRNTPPRFRKYTRKKLQDNIRSITSVGRTTIAIEQLKQPTKDEWIAKGWKVFNYHNWVFAVKLTVTLKGIVRAEIQDGCFNGDYHNDKMQTQPYDESRQNTKLVVTESQLRSIICESIRRILSVS